MNLCSGGSTNDTKHPEIAHEEHSNDCPLCSVKAELGESEKKLAEALDENKDLKEENVGLRHELADWAERTKHMSWAVEDVPEAKI